MSLDPSKSRRIYRGETQEAEAKARSDAIDRELELEKSATITGMVQYPPESNGRQRSSPPPKSFNTKRKASRMLDRDVGSIGPKRTESRTDHQSRLAPLSVPLDGEQAYATAESYVPIEAHPKTKKLHRHHYRQQVRRYAQRIAPAIPLLAYLNKEQPIPVKSKSQDATPKILVAEYTGGSKPDLSVLECSQLLDVHGLRYRLDLDLKPKPVIAQLIVVLDLSPHLVNVLGGALDINPLVFISALKDVWSGNKSDLQEMTPGDLFREENFGSNLFSYETETIITTSYLCYSTKNDNADLEARLENIALIDSIDAAFLAEVSHNAPSERIIKPVHPLFCPPLHKGPSGAIELRRSYQATNRLTVYHVPNNKIPTRRSTPHVWIAHQLFAYANTVLILTANSNSGALHGQGQFIQEYDGLENVTPKWVNRLTSQLFGRQPTSFVGI